MLIMDLKDCEEIIAGDGTLLRELLHPAKANLDLRYSLAHASIPSGESSKPHKLRISEVYYILEGEGEMFIDNESGTVMVGQAVYIPPNTTQYILNTGKSELRFLCIVDPAWRSQDEEIIQ